MTLSNVHTHSPFDIPPTQCPVDPGTHQDIALRTPGNGEDMTGMSHQGTEQVSTAGIPEQYFPGAAPTTTTCQESPIRTPHDACHSRTVWSSLHVASRVPSGLQLTALTRLVCPCPTQRQVLLEISQTRTTWS